MICAQIVTWVLISMPRLGVLLFFVIDSVCPSVHLSVCHAAPSNRFFFFVCRRNQAIVGHHLSMWHSAKHCSSIFTAQCTLVQMHGLGIACRLSVCLSVRDVGEL